MEQLTQGPIEVGHHVWYAAGLGDIRLARVDKIVSKLGVVDLTLIVDGTEKISNEEGEEVDTVVDPVRIHRIQDQETQRVTFVVHNGVDGEKLTNVEYDPNGIPGTWHEV